ncbi:MAG: aminoglycoside phosphotransferase family protein [Gammaproteobacteria bacterium]|nr:aminoglycoside phosphotransferase family protein [Gammaproteobacteria bacterium]
MLSDAKTLITTIRTLYGEAGEIWLYELPTQIKELSHTLGFRFISVIPNLSYNFVGLVEMPARDQIAILKIGLDNTRIASEVKWLGSIGEGVPKIYAYDEAHNAYLMECLQPGDSLKGLVRLGQDDEATRIICQVISSLQSQQATKVGFKHIAELAKDLEILQGHYDPKILSKAIGLFHDLSVDKSTDVLLHGDLHHDNILVAGESWKAIDPHGYIGDPVAEVGAMIRNPYDCFPNGQSLAKIVDRRLNILAEELPFDGKRIKAWAFCLTVLSDAWTFEAHGKVTELELVAALDGFKV